MEVYIEHWSTNLHTNFTSPYKVRIKEIIEESNETRGLCGPSRPKACKMLMLRVSTNET